MGWFTKKDTGKNIEKRPELPELSELSNQHSVDLAIPSPPTSPSNPPPLPNTSQQKVTKDLSEENFKTQNNEPKPGMQKSRFASPEYQTSPPALNYVPPKPQEHSYPQTSVPLPPQIKNPPKRENVVFIKLDKFQITMEAFRDISQKISEIEDILVKTKELKAREEKELEDWEREIEAMKIKIDTIGKEITGPEF